MRITALLRKIHELASQAEQATAIDVDLMLDYTRILYADLLEWREDIREQTAPHAAPAFGSTRPAAPEEAAAAPRVEQPAPAPRPEPEPQPVPEPEPAALQAVPEPEPPVSDEPTLEEYMARLAGTPIHREPAAARSSEPDPVYAPQPAAAAPPRPPAVEAHTEAPVAQAPVSAAPPRPARDIRSMIGINDKYQIMSELFGNDKAAYEEALDMVNRAETEQAAFNWLREQLWVTEDHSDAAMIFFDVVRRFKNS